MWVLLMYLKDKDGSLTSAKHLLQREPSMGCVRASMMEVNLPIHSVVFCGIKKSKVWLNSIP